MKERQDQVPGLAHGVHIWIWSSPYPPSPGQWTVVTLMVHARTNTPTPATSNYFGFALVVNLEMYKVSQHFVGQEKHFPNSV